ncbi:hypothetical protein TRFO_14508 [Tritrichomonas foetus]|uniref:Calcineurin-like phosphoesterase domain-containing protein n=1 Tax=Tritrichomonas foetus TaxID=1144522 RepID=A0A1J4KV51_9EUKA|nr:hypothetical protein TRFO_14508 [Tritrichomonas foetus]|eukprot:OHT15018.1 hypothetical protein TRFO_14508 [Tritrichomonas foetus]
MRFRQVAYFLAQYLWVGMLGLCLISTIEFKTPSQTGDISSNPYHPDFDATKEPVWFLHYTDVHLSTTKNNYATILRRFNTSLSLFQPDQIFITGDICDSFGGNKFPRYPNQMEEDWDLYKRLLSELNISNPIHIAGNHDIFNLYSFESERHYANGFIYNESNYLINRVNFNDDLDFITINPFTFPTPSVYLIWWISPSSGMRGEINQELSKSNTPLSISTSHIPAKLWFPSFSTDLRASENVRLYLSGHLHPPEPIFFHHGPKTVEIVGTPLFNSNQVGLIAVDNGQFSHHQMKFGKKTTSDKDKNSNKDNLVDGTFDKDSSKFAILTQPIPDYQRSSLERFDEINPIRAISFTPGMNLSFRIDEGPVRRLECSPLKKRPQFEFCTAPATHSLGTHTFTKLGDWTGSFNFTVGNTIPSFEEACYFDEPSSSYLACFFTYLVFAVIITLPFNLVHFSDRFDAWLESETIDANTKGANTNNLNSTNNNNVNTIVSNLNSSNNSDSNDYLNESRCNGCGNSNLYWILAVFAGFFVVKMRISRLPFWLRLIAFVSVVWCFVLPYCFFDIEGHTGMFWLWGYIVGGKAIFLQTPARFGTYYLIFVIAPFFIILSSMQKLISNRLRFMPIMIVDIAIYLSSFYFCYLFAYELSKDFGYFYGISSFAFVVIPAFLFISLVVWLIYSIIYGVKHRYDQKISSVPLSNSDL